MTGLSPGLAEIPRPVATGRGAAGRKAGVRPEEGRRGRNKGIWGAYGEESVKTKAPEKSVNAKSDVLCSTCGLKFRSKRRRITDKAFCSDRCRLLYWAAGEIIREWKAGHAEGLRAVIEELKS